MKIKAKIKEADDPEVGLVDASVSFNQRVIKQINDEYNAAWWFHKSRVNEWQKRLKLYNNQMRNKDRIGSPDIFAFHQALLSNLYDDRMIANFKPRCPEDLEIVGNFSDLAENDYIESEMDQLDYDWDFDASLFGRGLLLFDDYDFKSETPLGEVIDPLTWLRDPTAQSVNGNRLGNNAMRFGGREIRRTEKEIFGSGDYFNTQFLRNDNQSFSAFSPFWSAERERKAAQGYNAPFFSQNVRQNREWVLLQWFTIIDGTRYVVELGNDRTLIVRMKRIKNEFPIIDRTLYPIAHDWDGVSVFDIMEDKQRFRAGILNVYGDAAKRMAYPMRLFDENKIRKNVDKDPEFDKWVPVDGDPNRAVAPMPNPVIGGEVNFVLDFLDKASQRALGISDINLGQIPPSLARGKLGLVQAQQQKTDKRFSLALKIWGWSEKKRWKRWYELYEENLDGGISKKILITEGVSGTEHKELSKKDIVCSHELGPIIEIESRVESEAKKLREYQKLKDYVLTTAQLPESDKLYGLRKLGELVMQRKEVLLQLPYTADEQIALEENEKLNEGKPQQVKIQDNHIVHLRINGQAKDNPESEAHLKMHRFAFEMKRTNPKLFPNMNPEGQQQGDAASPAMRGASDNQMVRPANEGMGVNG